MNGDFIDKLLQALHNNLIKKEILKIVNNKEDFNSVENEKNIEKYKKVIEKLKQQSIENDKKYSDLFNKFESMKKLLMLEKDESDKYKQIIEQSKKENNEYKEKYEIQKQKCIEKDEEIIRYKKQLNIIRSNCDELANKVNYYENTYKNLNECFNNFISLRNEIKDDLSNVIKSDNSELFLCSGVQWDNIDALWCFISYKLNEYDEYEIGILINTFEFFFEKYNRINCLYEIIDVNIGEEFDEDFHTRAADSRVAGNISEILLKGYRNTRNGKIIHKSIVRV